MKPVPDYVGLVKHLELEHRHLEGLLVDLHQLLLLWQDQPVSAVTKQAAIDAADNVLREITAHFREEEQEGCLEEVACHCPKLSHQVQQLRAQHAELQGHFEQLVQVIRLSPQQALQQFEIVQTAIKKHEHEENLLIEQAFGECLQEENGFHREEAVGE